MKKLLSIVMCSTLVACSASDTAFLQPEASYLNHQKVSSVPKSQSITVVGSYHDEMGNAFPAYPQPADKAHKIVHLSPVPQQVYVVCEHKYLQAAGQSSQNVTERGRGYAKGNFEAGKTYMVFCNRQANKQFQIVAREVPDGTKYRGAWSSEHSSKGSKPTDNNRVRFIITGKSSRSFWRWVGNDYMAIQNWDGSFGETAELAAPIEYVKVECQSGADKIVVPLKAAFQVGKTYQLACRKNSQNLLEAYIVQSQ